MNITNEAGLTQRQHAAWLDWMIYVHGIGIDTAKALTLAEPGDGNGYKMAKALLEWWQVCPDQPLEFQP